MPRTLALLPLLAGLATLLAALGLGLADPAPLQALRALNRALLPALDPLQETAHAARRLEMLLAFATSAFAVVYLARRDVASARRAVLVGVLVIAGATWSAHVRGVGADPQFPLLALGLTSASAALALGLSRRRAASDLTRTFGASLARPHIAAMAAASTGSHTLDDARRAVSVVHVACDLAAGVDADLARVRRVVVPLAGRLREAGAYVTLALDGSVTAIWNAPLDQPAHAALAGRAALALRPLADSLAAALSMGQGATAFRLGIGIASGDALTGRMGSTARPLYAVLGPPVDEARRLQQESLASGMPFLVSVATARAAPELATLPIDPGALLLMGDDLVGRAREFRALKPLLAELEANLKIKASRDVAAILDELAKRPWPALWPPLAPLIAHYERRARSERTA